MGKQECDTVENTGFSRSVDPHQDCRFSLMELQRQIADATERVDFQALDFHGL
ncbi:hypothetical protein MC7420_258 [Coleofasciculus chthonoplastes PCC 7420]|uniref:Uncharacterized protein n=1 Tax=Coleofasciculus chthonoplastes PCC 7420 TaxID=118168 RepID=B4VLH4_9CYAN|nr:hypothetical protein MC7420_258 [Coleofasciculus chthonoplastes PCC 7420]